METVGIVGFSFALTKDELARKKANPCNQKIAEEIVRLAEEEQEYGNGVIVVVQWEIGLALRKLEFDFGYSIVNQHRTPKAYLDSDEVMAQAAQIFQDRGITRVIPVTQPFLLLEKCCYLVRRAGFKLDRRVIRWVGFCKDSVQPWTRGPIKLLWYAIRQMLLGHQGH